MNKFILAFIFLVSIGFVNKSFAANLDNNIIVCVMLVVADDDDDEATITAIFTTLQTAEKIANLLNVELSASKDPVTDNAFLFNLKSPDQQNLVMKVLDEEGKEVGENAFTTTVGSNYRQLNVERLDDGTYTMRFTDGNGAEIEREFVISRGKKVD